MYICIYIYIYVYIYIYMYLSLSISLSLYIYIYTYHSCYSSLLTVSEPPWTSPILSRPAPVRSVFKISNLFLRPRPWQFEIRDSTDK